MQKEIKKTQSTDNQTGNEPNTDPIVEITPPRVIEAEPNPGKDFQFEYALYIRPDVVINTPTLSKHETVISLSRQLDVSATFLKRSIPSLALIPHSQKECPILAIVVPRFQKKNHDPFYRTAI